MERKKLILVARLAEFGEPGEREAAQYILGEHGVTARELLEDVESPDDNVYVEIPYKTVEERTIIVQNYCRLFNVDEVTSWQRGRSRTFEVPANKAAEFRESCDRLKKQWRKDLKTLLDAFIQKNRIFSDLPATGPSGLSPEDVYEIMRVANALKRANLNEKLLNE